MCTEHERTGRRPGIGSSPRSSADLPDLWHRRRREQRWNVYATSLLAFSLVSVLLLYTMHRLQGVLPFNPTDRAGVSPMGSFNAAISFVTNTNWQWYSGELTISHLTNMLGEVADHDSPSCRCQFMLVTKLIAALNEPMGLTPARSVGLNGSTPCRRCIAYSRSTETRLKASSDVA